MRKSILIFIGVMLLGFVSQAQTANYIIQRGDIIDIVVMEHPEFSIAHNIVLPDGFMQYPGLGSMKVAGISSEQFQDSLQKALEKFVVNPVVTVTIIKIEQQMLNVYGHVNKPGQFQIFQSMDLFSALGLAGGLKSFKKVKTVLIIHANKQVEEIDIRDLFKTDLSKTKIPIVDAGDTVYVKEPNEFNWARLSFIVTLANLIAMTAYYFTK